MVRYVGRSAAEVLLRPRNDECPLAATSSVPAAEGRRQAARRRAILPEIAAALGCHQRTVSRKKREAMAMLGVANNSGLFHAAMHPELQKIDSHI
jgi:two-component system capsular synthesis response regulator RcsB